MNIFGYFKSGSSGKRDLSEQSNDGEFCKKPRKGSLNDSIALNSTALEDVFTGSLQSPECGETLIKCLQDVEQRMSEMIKLLKAKQESQIKGELHMRKLQESVDFLGAKFHEYQKDKKQKKKR